MCDFDLGPLHVIRILGTSVLCVSVRKQVSQPYPAPRHASLLPLPQRSSAPPPRHNPVAPFT
ncbi:hypothetical protein E2C01_097797 [Portunus trituberculatus]|uniref:Uncharacterized protein n=1 Tax=Portunus trituberculatus TaxID=210409 RepID=A0A5B7KAH1_PORTR|nr:hypothetical protein [Portunus trituberculatus]